MSVLVAVAGLLGFTGLLGGRASRAVDPNVTRLRQVRDLLESWGHTVIEVPGWETRGAGSWSPIAWLWHHTAGPRSGDTPSLRVCTFGRAGLRNALCNTYTSRSGVVYIVAARRAWHAGAGTLVTNGRAGGNEGENTGLGESWTGSYAAQVALAAAIAIVFGIGPAKQWDHKEHAKGRKIDRAGIAPAVFRADVAAFITSKTAPPKGWDEVATKDEIKDAFREVLTEPSATYVMAVEGRQYLVDERLRLASYIPDNASLQKLVGMYGTRPGITRNELRAHFEVDDQ